jgi:retron-type reverse transcriptase
MLLEAIYEQDFYDCSYGFRPGRSPHDALHEVRERCMQEGIGWIVDADVSGYFNSIDWTQLREVLRKRVNDGRIAHLIGKWLRAGVMEEGVRHHPESGVVQGGVLSPCWRIYSSIISWMTGSSGRYSHGGGKRQDVYARDSSARPWLSWYRSRKYSLSTWRISVGRIAFSG